MKPKTSTSDNLSSSKIGFAFGLGVFIATVATSGAFYLLSKAKRKPTKTGKASRTVSVNSSGISIGKQEKEEARGIKSKDDSFKADRTFILKELISKQHPLTVIESVSVYRSRLKDAMKKEEPNAMLTKEVLLILNEWFISAYLPHFRQVTVSNRKTRRRFLEKNTESDFAEYAKCCLTEVHEFDEGMAQNTENILVEAGIESERYHGALQYYTTIDKEFYVMIMMMFEKLKVANRKKASDFDYQKGKQILKRQIEIMQADEPRLVIIEEEARGPVKQILMNDLIYQEFAVEEEDFLLNQIEKAWEQNEDFLVLVNHLQAFM